MEALLYIGISQSLFAAFLILVKKEKHVYNVILSVWLLLMAVQMMSVLFGHIRVQMHFTSMIMLKFIPFTYGPFLYIYAKTLVLSKPVFRVKYLWHFLPSVVFLVFFWSVASHGTIIHELSGSFLTGELSHFHIAYAVLLVGSISFYVVKVLYLVRVHNQKVQDYFSFDSSRTNLRWIRTIGLIFAVAYTLAVLSRILNVYNREELLHPEIFPITGLTLFAYALSLFGFNQDAVFVNERFLRLKRRKERLAEADQEEEEIKYKKYERSGLKAQEAVEYCNRILAYMNEKKPYLDGNFTLETMAAELNVPKHYLTQVINENLNKNFYTFVNEYRIEEVKKRMANRKYDNLTLLAIAYDSGFNSKTAFNTIFKKMTGQTPSEHRSSIQKTD